MFCVIASLVYVCTVVIEIADVKMAEKPMKNAANKSEEKSFIIFQELII